MPGSGGASGVFYEMNYDDTVTGFSSSGSGDYTYFDTIDGANDYDSTFAPFTLNPGQSLTVEFYASTDAIATPSPSSGTALAVGVGGLALLRRRRSKR